MTETTNEFGGTDGGLPDPDADRQFYDGVPSRRLVAWFIDAVIILAMAGRQRLPSSGILTLGLGFFMMPLVVHGASASSTAC